MIVARANGKPKPIVWKKCNAVEYERVYSFIMELDNISSQSVTKLRVYFDLYKMIWTGEYLFNMETEMGLPHDILAEEIHDRFKDCTLLNSFDLFFNKLYTRDIQGIFIKKLEEGCYENVQL